MFTKVFWGIKYHSDFDFLMHVCHYLPWKVKFQSKMSSSSIPPSSLKVPSVHSSSNVGAYFSISSIHIRDGRVPGFGPMPFLFLSRTRYRWFGLKCTNQNSREQKMFNSGEGRYTWKTKWSGRSTTGMRQKTGSKAKKGSIYYNDYDDDYETKTLEGDLSRINKLAMSQDTRGEYKYRACLGMWNRWGQNNQGAGDPGEEGGGEAESRQQIMTIIRTWALATVANTCHQYQGALLFLFYDQELNGMHGVSKRVVSHKRPAGRFWRALIRHAG